jgi:RhtB (resistance to homoserine/threonine) family protein
MPDLWLEFSKVAVAHVLAVASPGPDFALVLRQSLAHGRRTALWTSVGVGTAILVHASYSLLGLGLLLRGSAAWFTAVKFAGAAYLTWLGVQALRARPRPHPGNDSAVGALGMTANALPASRAFLAGFLTNALNPKATLFFISLFALVVSPQTPKLVQAAYGAWMAVATTGWFCLVAMMFTRSEVRHVYLRHGHWIDRALGIIFLAFAASLALAAVR